jgi:hypothetical protein
LRAAGGEWRSSRFPAPEAVALAAVTVDGWRRSQEVVERECDDPLKMQRFFGAIRVLPHAMHEHERELAAGVPSGPFGYQVCDGCGVAIQRRLADGHVCAPARYAAQQASRLHWRRAGFDDALSRWLQTSTGRFAQYYARRMVRGAPAPRPGEA